LGNIFCFVDSAVVVAAGTIISLSTGFCGLPSIYPNELVSRNKKLSVISSKMDRNTMAVDLEIWPEQRVIITV
jgi:hypothetical protein